MLNKKIIFGYSAMMITSFGIGIAYAADQDIGASISFREALSITNVVDMAFGTVEFSNGAGAAAITLAFDGTLSTDNPDYTTAVSGTAGSFDFSGSTGQIVDISCDTTGTVSDGTNTLALGQVIVSLNGGITPYTCAGIDTTPATHTLDGTDALVMGSVLSVSDSAVLTTSEYNTSNANGVPVNVKIVYQ